MYCELGYKCFVSFLANLLIIIKITNVKQKKTGRGTGFFIKLIVNILSY